MDLPTGLFSVRTVSRGGNSTTLNSIRQELDHIGDMLEGSFAVDINKLSHKVCMATLCCVHGRGTALCCVVGRAPLCAVW